MERHNLLTYEYPCIPTRLPVVMCTNLIKLNKFSGKFSVRSETREKAGSLISQVK